MERLYNILCGNTISPAKTELTGGFGRRAVGTLRQSGGHPPEAAPGRTQSS